MGGGGGEADLEYYSSLLAAFFFPHFLGFHLFPITPSFLCSFTQLSPPFLTD